MQFGFWNAQLVSARCRFKQVQCEESYDSKEDADHGCLALLVIASVMAPSLMAQSLVSGDLTGTVTDPSGAVVSGATVTLKSDTTGATRTTTTQRQRRLPLLAVAAGQLHGHGECDGIQQSPIHHHHRRRPGDHRRCEDGRRFQLADGGSHHRGAAGAGRQRRPFHQLQSDPDRQPA